MTDNRLKKEPSVKTCNIPAQQKNGQTEAKAGLAFSRAGTTVKQDRSFIARFERSIRKRGEILGDLLFSVMVQVRPTKAFRKFYTDAKLIRRSGLFDAGWYLKKYNKRIRPSQDPVYHYLTVGAALGYKPSETFNTAAYLERYPGVLAAKENPLLHYLRCGKRGKGNIGLASCADIIDATILHCAAQFARLDASKKTVLLVTHEMSRTGAPILLLNIAKQFKNRFNVIILALEQGALQSEFTKACDVLIGSTIPRAHLHSEHLYNLLFQRISSEHPITFSVVNTIVSHIVLKPLWENDIPSIHLIHEFASNFPQNGWFRRSAQHSSIQVFSASIVRESAILECPEIQTGRSIILPQGINSAPGSMNDPEYAAAERQRIRDLFRPEGFPEDTVVVVGIGTVQIRKGVDLFIACAKRVADKRPKTKFRFVWIGHGFNPQGDEYSLFLADQIQRSNVTDILALTGEVVEIETAHQLSDILFLSSRLDPLPQVSQDSMAHAKPVVCFESTTGVVEYLAEDPDAAFGVVPYLDIEEAANRICRLIDDTSWRLQVGEACRRLGASRFSFQNYIRRIEEIGLKEAARKIIEKSDLALIQQSNMFRFDFYCSQAHDQTEDHCLKQYMNQWRSGIDPRGALPGFHPGIYAECNNVDGRDPLAHYIEAGKPGGPWCFEVIEYNGPAVIEKSLKVGLHLHLYFPDLAGDLFRRLNSVKTPMDLLISVPSTEVARAIEREVAQCAQSKIEIRVLPNRGRDIGPFVTGFGQEILDNYDIIGHLHSKKTSYVSDRDLIVKWVDFLYENLIGGQKRMADTIISRMSLDKTIGLVFPDDPHVIGWGKNWVYAQALSERLGITDLLPNASFKFPIGTMFWARTAALRPLFELGLQWDDYPPEPLPIDGTMLHAIERLLPAIAKQSGFSSAVTHVAGVTR